MIYGIAYHSPLDVMTLLPFDTLVTTDPTEAKEVLITDKYFNKYDSKLQLVFASTRDLLGYNIPILDQGPWGKILSLTTYQFEVVLNKVNVNNTVPEWIRIFRKEI